MKEILFLLLHISGCMGGFKVEVPPTVYAKLGDPLLIPCSYTSESTLGRVDELRWGEISGGYEHLVYTFINGVTDQVETPPWREKLDMERYSRKDLSLLINNFSEEDKRRKCCEVVTKSPYGKDSACTRIIATGAQVYSAAGSEESQAGCNCAAKIGALGFLSAVTTIIMVGLVVYILKYLK